MKDFKMEFETELSEQECKAIIDKEIEKDIREAQIIVNVLQGKIGNLALLRRKVAGQILHEFQKMTMSKEKREAIITTMKIRIEKGAERFISYENGKLVVEFDALGKMGSDLTKTTKISERNLVKRFRAKTFRYV